MRCSSRGRSRPAGAERQVKQLREFLTTALVSGVLIVVPSYLAIPLVLKEGGSIARNPQGPDTPFDPSEPTEKKRVQRGGSFLCTGITAP
jgi:hypothetical protein